MRIQLLTRIRQDRSKHKMSLELFYAYYQITRQGYWKALKRMEEQGGVIERLTQEVEQYRQLDSRAGSRSMYYNMDIKHRYGLGVSKFEKLLSEQGLTLLPCRVRVVTTRSSFQSWNYENLTHGLELTSVNQLVVGDLTYIGVGGAVYYLFLLTDVYSCRIVGHCLDTRMRKEEAMRALNQWIEMRGADKVQNCIHHTDGGSQYFSGSYLKELAEHEIQVSAAKSCLENGYAEQRNGLIKNHFAPILRNMSEGTAKTEVARIIHFLNYKRKQKRLGWLSPVAFENKYADQVGPVRKCHDFTKGSKPKKGF